MSNLPIPGSPVPANANTAAESNQQAEQTWQLQVMIAFYNSSTGLDEERVHMSYRGTEPLASFRDRVVGRLDSMIEKTALPASQAAENRKE